MKRRKPTSEPAFNLAALRKQMRLLRRVLRGLEDMEKYLVKLERGDTKGGRAATPEEIAATVELYETGKALAEAFEVPRCAQCEDIIEKGQGSTTVNGRLYHADWHDCEGESTPEIGSKP